MCGIVGACAKRNVTEILLEGLRRLEYRGYDSAGIAVIADDGRLCRERVQGKVQQLAQVLQSHPLAGSVGIAHTRWATHGVPSTANAHPHVSGDNIVVVHNGIIENHSELRDRLQSAGYVFSSDTDTEVVAHLLHFHLAQGLTMLQGLSQLSAQLRGAYALAILNQATPEILYAMRQGSPLVLGCGFDENFVASDHLALLPATQRFKYLEDGDIAILSQQHIEILDADGNYVDRALQTHAVDTQRIDKAGYRHFMLKEIFEQPLAIIDTLEGRLYGNCLVEQAFGVTALDALNDVKRLTIVACGTSYHAGLVAKYWLEEYARLPTTVEIASEFRYRTPVVEPHSLFITLSQSGETADTLAALREAKHLGYQTTLAICNRPESALVRESSLHLMTRAGQEIGVASTKAFTTQLTILLLLTAVLAKKHNPHFNEESRFVAALQHLPTAIRDVLLQNGTIKYLAQQFVDKQHALFLGRGALHPIAMEGALKLKEISYIHAEAYPAGELKHGPLALVDREMPVIAVAPNDKLLEKLQANLAEVRARGGRLYVFADKSVKLQDNEGVTFVEMPAVDPLTAAIVYTVPLQLLAYHVAVVKGTDVDQPRNLAKSVTVE